MNFWTLIKIVIDFPITTVKRKQLKEPGSVRVAATWRKRDHILQKEVTLQNDNCICFNRVLNNWPNRDLFEARWETSVEQAFHGPTSVLIWSKTVGRNGTLQNRFEPIFYVLTGCRRENSLFLPSRKKRQLCICHLWICLGYERLKSLIFGSRPTKDDIVLYLLTFWTVFFFPFELHCDITWKFNPRKAYSKKTQPSRQASIVTDKQLVVEGDFRNVHTSWSVFSTCHLWNVSASPFEVQREYIHA